MVVGRSPKTHRGPTKREKSGCMREVREQRLITSETEGSVAWGVEPIAGILSGFLKYCYMIWSSEGVKKEVVGVASPSQGRVHRHHAVLLLLEFRA